MSAAGRWAGRVIRGYQLLVSPWIGAHCRFAPSCSEYARVAMEEQGLARGTWLAARRLLKCQPLHPGGYDPPPARPEQG